ncbi:MAG TPA: phosphodiester glycosidase family protein [Oculatellaceae cyanobacterium]
MTQTQQSVSSNNKISTSRVLNLLLASALTAGTVASSAADAFVRAHGPLTLKLGSAVRRSNQQHQTVASSSHRQTAQTNTLQKGANKAGKSHLALHGKKGKRGKNGKWEAEVATAAKPIPPQNFIANLQSETVAPGVVHKFVRGPLSINVIDVDMERAPVKVQPYMAGESFDRLKDVADHARESKALAAINANYFKKDGTPLGTLIVDGEWVAGPIFDRVSMGIDRSGKVKIDRVSLNGLLSSSNADVDNVWVNNINQPRRHGSHLIAYTRRWGSYVRTPLTGHLVSVNAQGQVQDSVDAQSIGIPYGGFVLSDTKDGAISSLRRGDNVQLSWHTKPGDWQDVVEAVSGGPMLVKDGSLFVDLKDENFRKAWTGSQIRARTAIGVTANNHLLLTTVEGPHTLWDVAKFLHNLGAVDAMNLDGGGSTTMVVHGNTVTRNANASQRRVASSIVVLDKRNMATSTAAKKAQPARDDEPQDLSDATNGSDVAQTLGEITTVGKDITAALPMSVRTDRMQADSQATSIDDSLQAQAITP